MPQNNFQENFVWITEGLLIFVFGIIGLLGNGISIWTFWRQRVHRIFHNLLLSLAIFDMVSQRIYVLLYVVVFWYHHDTYALNWIENTMGDLAIVFSIITSYITTYWLLYNYIIHACNVVLVCIFKPVNVLFLVTVTKVLFFFLEKCRYMWPVQSICLPWPSSGHPTTSLPEFLPSLMSYPLHKSVLWEVFTVQWLWHWKDFWLFVTHSYLEGKPLHLTHVFKSKAQLCLMKWPSERLQNLPWNWDFYCFSFCATFFTNQSDREKNKVLAWNER